MVVSQFMMTNLGSRPLRHTSAVISEVCFRFSFLLLSPLVNMFERTTSLNLEQGEVLCLSVHQSAATSSSCCKSLSCDAGEALM